MRGQDTELHFSTVQSLIVNYRLEKKPVMHL